MKGGNLHDEIKIFVINISDIIIIIIIVVIVVVIKVIKSKEFQWATHALNRCQEVRTKFRWGILGRLRRQW
jgi:hypothetical protein